MADDLESKIDSFIKTKYKKGLLNSVGFSYFKHNGYNSTDFENLINHLGFEDALDLFINWATELTPELVSNFNYSKEELSILNSCPNYTIPTIFEFSKYNITLDEIISFNSKIDPLEWDYPETLPIIGIIKSAYSPKEIRSFLDNQISPEEASKFNICFIGHGLDKLIRNSCSHEIPNLLLSFPEDSYYWMGFSSLNSVSHDGNSFNIDSMIVIDKLNFPVVDLEEKLLDYSFRSLCKSVGHYLNVGKGDLTNYEFIGVGGLGIIIKKKVTYNAFKFAYDLSHELKCLNILKEHNSSHKFIYQLKDNHIINNGPHLDFNIACKGHPHFNGDVMEIEYIPGKSLETLAEQGISNENILKYSSDIHTGLLELRAAGIYAHRDIRPPNIIVHEKLNRAIILDLGRATTNLKEAYNDTCRFGGENDHVALGQVIYNLYTKQHIFTDSTSMSVTKIKTELKDERDLVYQDKNSDLFQSYLQKVKNNVKDKRISDLIVHCLQSEGQEKDYISLKKMFNSVL